MIHKITYICRTCVPINIKITYIFQYFHNIHLERNIIMHIIVVSFKNNSEDSHTCCVYQITNIKYVSIYSQNITMLYYQVLYNLSITCFGHYLTIIWLYQAYRVTVLRFWLPAVAMAQPSQRPATKNVCKTRGCNYSFWAPDDGRCIARNILSN